MIARAIIVGLAGVLLALQAVRTAAVADPATRLTIGARLWPSHPSVRIERAMSAIGASAARGETPPPTTLRQVEEVAARAPLASEPFLINGALAQVRQQDELAERLFTAARTRAPRSVAARYFLADRYLRTNRIPLALNEIAVLSRLFPQARAQFGPALAAFARTPGAASQLRRFFRSSPELEPVVLSALAEDGRNADLVLALWSRRSDAAQPQWEAKLVNGLVEQGQFDKAYSTWRQVAGMSDARGPIFNPGFRKVAAPPPFNWTFAKSGGVVEPAPGGQLQIIYYGRDKATLAQQLLLLPPGGYQLSMDVSGSVGQGGETAWTLTCLPRGAEIARLPINRKGPLASRFSVPPGCRAQRLQLLGSPGEFPQSQDFTIGKLGLVKAGGQ